MIQTHRLNSVSKNVNSRNSDDGGNLSTPSNMANFPSEGNYGSNLQEGVYSQMNTNTTISNMMMDNNNMIRGSNGNMNTITSAENGMMAPTFNNGAAVNSGMTTNGMMPQNAQDPNSNGNMNSMNANSFGSNGSSNMNGMIPMDQQQMQQDGQTHYGSCAEKSVHMSKVSLSRL